MPFIYYSFLVKLNKKIPFVRRGWKSGGKEGGGGGGGGGGEERKKKSPITRQRRGKRERGACAFLSRMPGTIPPFFFSFFFGQMSRINKSQRKNKNTTLSKEKKLSGSFCCCCCFSYLTASLLRCVHTSTLQHSETPMRGEQLAKFFCLFPQPHPPFALSQFFNTGACK